MIHHSARVATIGGYPYGYRQTLAEAYDEHFYSVQAYLSALLN